MRNWGCTRFYNLLSLLYNLISSNKQSPDHTRSYGPGNTILVRNFITAQNRSSKERNVRQDYIV